MIKTLIYFYTTFIIRIPSFLVIFKKILLKTGTGDGSLFPSGLKFKILTGTENRPLFPFLLFHTLGRSSKASSIFTWG